MTDEELDGYLVLILFCSKRKILALKKIYKILLEGNIQESSVRTLQQFST